MRNCHVLSSPQTNIIYVSIDRSIHPPVNQWINQIKSKKSNQTIKSIQTKSVQFKSNKNQTIKLSNISIIMHHHHHHRYASTITHHVSSSVTINRPSPPNQPRAFCVNSAGLCSCSMYSKAYLLRSVIHPCIHVGLMKLHYPGAPKDTKTTKRHLLGIFLRGKLYPCKYWAMMLRPERKSRFENLKLPNEAYMLQSTRLIWIFMGWKGSLIG